MTRLFCRVQVLSAAVLAFVGATALTAAAEAQSCGAPEASSGSSSSDSSDSSDESSSSDDSSWGGGFGSDDDHDYGSSSSSSSSSSSRRPACEDTTDVTGLENCTRFGAGWNATWPALRLELGPSFRRLSLEGMTFGGVTYHEGNPHRFTLDVADFEDPFVTTGGVNFRVTGALGRHFILGAELDISFGGGSLGSVSEGDRMLEADGLVAYGGGLVAGVSIPVGPLRFRGELYAGGQAVAVTTTSHLGDCIAESREVLGRWVIEPRVGIEFFTSRFLSVDLWGGTDLINTGSFSGGLRLSFHTRSYDAVR